MRPVRVPQVSQCGSCSKFDDCPVSNFEGMKVVGKPCYCDGEVIVEIDCTEYEREDEDD